ncbi:MAG TPA: hypothetical protein VHX42_03785 [Candidatus Babeliales bacterium]|jgi:hypothetical protein|nr:hypothetical protein [Candidatus Babeliales bacterium]
MMTKQMMFATMVFISINNVTFTMFSKKEFIFNDRMHTKINGNRIISYICLGREQDNPSYVFKHTKIIECSKDKKLTETDTLGSLEKAYRLRNQRDYNLAQPFYRFEKFVKMNNAIYCADLEQKLNYFDKLEDVGAIVYGTQDVKDCVLVREFVKQQQLAAKNNKSEKDSAQK